MSAADIYRTVSIDRDGIRLDGTGIKINATGTDIEVTDYEGQFTEVTFTVYAEHVTIADELPNHTSVWRRSE